MTTEDNNDDAVLERAKRRYKQSEENESENRNDALSDLRFARLAEQWPESVMRQREEENRPCLTINKLPAIIRQVVNDARQNKPALKTKPVDSNSDPKTAEILNGLIRNIEYASNAAAAYDTAVDYAVTTGIGFLRVGIEYSHDDTFDLDIQIERVENPASVYMDANSVAEDSRDWDYALVVERLPREEFKEKYKDSEQVDWDTEGYNDLDSSWADEKTITVAEYWERKEIEREIYLMSDRSVVAKDVYELNAAQYEITGVTPTQSRMAKSWEVKQYVMSGVEVLETNDWPGKFIPIIPVFGDDINVEGKRYLRSLIRDAKDPQRMFNYWRTASTELVALAPKAPYVGKKGSFNTDVNKWTTANVKSHPFIEYDGEVAPQRQAFAGIPAGALQEAMNSSDDIKTTTGIHDASMGAQGNETSGKAIIARQREGDTSTFHFLDNLNRAIRHTGRIIIDLIPHIYTGERMIRVLGEDGKEPKNVQLGQKPQEQPDDMMPEGAEEIYDLSVGKYDIVVDTGPSFTTRREEAATQMTELIRVYPPAAPLIGDLLATNLDWPGADEIAKRFKAALPPEVKAIIAEGEEQDPEALIAEINQMKQQFDQGKQMLEQLQKENEELKTDKTIEMKEVEVKQFDAETKRLTATNSGLTPEQVQQIVIDTITGVNVNGQ